MKRVGEAVLDKVKLEAQSLVSEAEKEAREEIERAREQRELKLREEKRRILAEAQEEAARIIAQGLIEGRKKLSSTKNDIIEETIGRAKKALPETRTNESKLLSLIEESADALGTDKGRIYVSPRDVAAAKRLLRGNRGLSSKIAEVRELDCAGGVIAEDAQGTIRIDNTYETRLEMLVPRLLPEMNRGLFGAP